MFYTNGLLLLKPSQSSFWKACSDYGISIELTRYPVELDIERIVDKARREKVVLNVFSDEVDRSAKDHKHSLKFQLDLTGRQPQYGFIDCFQMNNCSVLSNGSLYLCPTTACIGHFNVKFEQELPVGEHDYLDIHAAQSFQELA